MNSALSVEMIQAELYYKRLSKIIINFFKVMVEIFDSL